MVVLANVSALLQLLLFLVIPHNNNTLVAVGRKLGDVIRAQTHLNVCLMSGQTETNTTSPPNRQVPKSQNNMRYRRGYRGWFVLTNAITLDVSTIADMP